MPRRRIRVVHVVESFGGGVLTVIRQICSGLDPNEFEMIVIHSAREGLVNEDAEDFPPYVRLIPLRMTREIHPVEDARALARLVRLLRDLNPDVIHAHSSKAGALVRIARLFLRRGRVIYSPHGFSFLRTDVPRPVRWAFYAIEYALARLGGTIVACSSGEHELARRLSRDTTLIRNAVDVAWLSGFRRQAGDKPEATVTVATMGRITAQRDPKCFVEVARRVTTQVPRARFLWIGGGSWEDEDRLRRQGIGVTGWLPRDRALDVLAGVDIYLHPSRWEGLPLAVLEAMALGKPVVATPAVGNSDAVAHGETGLLCASPEGLVAATVQLAKDACGRRRLGVAAADRARKMFDLPGFLDSWRRAYLAQRDEGSVAVAGRSA